MLKVHSLLALCDHIWVCMYYMQVHWLSSLQSVPCSQLIHTGICRAQPTCDVCMYTPSCLQLLKNFLWLGGSFFSSACTPGMAQVLMNPQGLWTCTRWSCPSLEKAWVARYVRHLEGLENTSQMGNLFSNVSVAYSYRHQGIMTKKHSCIYKSDGDLLSTTSCSTLYRNE